MRSQPEVIRRGWAATGSGADIQKDVMPFVELGMTVREGKRSGISMVGRRKILGQGQGIGVGAFKYVKETIIQRGGIFIQINEGIGWTQLAVEIGCLPEHFEGGINASSSGLLVGSRAHIAIGRTRAVPCLMGCRIQIGVGGAAINPGIAGIATD